MKISRGNTVVFLCLLIVFVVSFGVRQLNYYLKKEKIRGGIDIVRQGRVIDEPYQRYSYSVVQLDGFRLEVEPQLRVGVGDYIRANGRVEARVIDNKRVQYWLVDPSIAVIERGAWAPVWSVGWWLYRAAELRGKLHTIIFQALPATHASLLVGIVLGTREAMPEYFYTALIATGTLHVIAASGYNISVVAKILLQIMTTFLKRKPAIIASIMGIALYALLAGLSPAVMRAAVMGGLAYTAQAVGRDYAAKWILLVSAVLMLWVSPALLASVSFQLSVVATAGILWLEPIFDAVLKNILGLKFFSRYGVQTAKTASSETIQAPGLTHTLVQQLHMSVDILRSSLSTTVAATVAVLPITLIIFDRVSLIAPVVNVLVLWLVPPLMFLGAVMMGLGVVWLPLARIVSFLAWPLLELFIQVVTWWGALPGASLEVAGVHWVFGVGWYVLWGAVVVSFQRRQRG